MTDIDAAVAEVAEERGWSRLRSATDLLGAWRSFVAECGRGYSMSIYEFENDRSVRGMIEQVLSDRRIVNSANYVEFRRLIDTEDARYRALFHRGVEVAGPDVPWWERGVPRFAGLELAADLADQFGVTVESAPPER